MFPAAVSARTKRGSLLDPMMIAGPSGMGRRYRKLYAGNHLNILHAAQAVADCNTWLISVRPSTQITARVTRAIAAFDAWINNDRRCDITANSQQVCC